MSYANLLLNVLYHIVMEMKIRESCLQSGTFIYKPGISVTKQDFHLQMGSLGLQMGFSGYYLPIIYIKLISKFRIGGYAILLRKEIHTMKDLRNPLTRTENFEHPSGNIMKELTEAELNSVAAGAGVARNSGGIACTLTGECNIGTHIKFCCYD